MELVKNTEKDVIYWGNLLEFLSVFTTRRKTDIATCQELQQNKKESHKKNFRGILFKQERYLASDTLYTARNGHFYLAKCCCCRASMKKVKRNVLVHIRKRTSLVEKASCTCPSGKSRYCNLAMALLYELAEYSLNSLEKVPPKEKACTNQLRKWGVPDDKETVKNQ